MSDRPVRSAARPGHLGDYFGFDSNSDDHFIDFDFGDMYVRLLYCLNDCWRDVIEY